MTCTICHDTGWVCENHPASAWYNKPGGYECGAGMPCQCVNDPPRLDTLFDSVDLIADK